MKIRQKYKSVLGVWMKNKKCLEKYILNGETLLQKKKKNKKLTNISRYTLKRKYGNVTRTRGGGSDRPKSGVVGLWFVYTATVIP